MAAWLMAQGLPHDAGGDASESTGSGSARCGSASQLQGRRTAGFPP